MNMYQVHSDVCCFKSSIFKRFILFFISIKESQQLSLNSIRPLTLILKHRYAFFFCSKGNHWRYIEILDVIFSIDILFTLYFSVRFYRRWPGAWIYTMILLQWRISLADTLQKYSQREQRKLLVNTTQTRWVWRKEIVIVHKAQYKHRVTITSTTIVYRLV